MQSHQQVQQGFTLIELMISLLIGLFIMGGVISVFVVNQQTVATKRNLDNTQEALRFTANTVSRIVRQADSISNTSTNSQLVVSFTGGSGLKNCLGVAIAGVQTDTFTYANNQLLCNNTALIDDITAISFLYGVDANADGVITNAEYTAAPADFTKVDSIRMSMTLTNGKTNRFTATLRNKMIAKYAG
jgi:prepilin-type N-terminal cleavage/methylation domain-containing protein